MKNRKYKRGLTLIEVLFVLGVLAVLLGVVFVLYSQNRSRSIADEYKQELVQILEIANEYRQSNNLFSETEIATLMPAKYNHPMGSTAFGMYSPWGGPINVYSNSTINYYHIDTSNIPYNICVQLQGINIDDLKGYGETGYSLSCDKNNNGHLYISATL